MDSQIVSEIANANVPNESQLLFFSRIRRGPRQFTPDSSQMPFELTVQSHGGDVQANTSEAVVAQGIHFLLCLRRSGHRLKRPG
jgi:hypothetical protein